MAMRWKAENMGEAAPETVAPQAELPGVVAPASTSELSLEEPPAFEDSPVALETPPAQ